MGYGYSADRGTLSRDTRKGRNAWKRQNRNQGKVGMMKKKEADTMSVERNENLS